MREPLSLRDSRMLRSLSCARCLLRPTQGQAMSSFAASIPAPSPVTAGGGQDGVSPLRGVFGVSPMAVLPECQESAKVWSASPYLGEELEHPALPVPSPR